MLRKLQRHIVNQAFKLWTAKNCYCEPGCHNSEPGSQTLASYCESRFIIFIVYREHCNSCMYVSVCTGHTIRSSAL